MFHMSRLAMDRRASAGARLYAELGEQTKRQTVEQHKAEYRARPLSERLNGVFAEQAAVPNPAQVRDMANPAKAYKPTHGGYPG